MVQAAHERKLTYAEYVQQEETSATKHEFFDGELFAMAGGTPEHSRLATVVSAVLEAQRGNGRCVAFNSDLHVQTGDGYGAHPDVAVVCGALERSADAERSITNPTLIVEVLSATTESFDREGKFKHYRSSPSFKEYVLVSYREPLIEAHLRNADGSWTTTFAGPGETIFLRSIDARLDVDVIYSGMTSVEGRMQLA